MKAVKKLISFALAMALCLGMSQMLVGAADAFAVQASHNLSISIKDAPVIVEDTNSDTISASYDSRYYKVTISQPASGNWSVDVSVINGRTNKSVYLYIPSKEYKNVDININNGLYSGGSYKAGQIKGTLYNGGIDFTLAKGFNGSVDIDSNNSIFNMISVDKYMNSDVVMTSDTNSLGAVPNYFSADNTNGRFTFFNGTGANKIDIALRGGSVGSLG